LAQADPAGQVAQVDQPQQTEADDPATPAQENGTNSQSSERRAQANGGDIVVTGVRFKGNEAISALKIPLSVKDTPQTVMAVTGDVINCASIKTFQDVYKVDASGGTSHSLDSFPRNYYRGFRQQGNNAIRIDGFRMPADLQLDLEPYERFEIVKGATSTLYGQNSVAGTLNAISKVPKDSFGGEIGLEAGSHDHYRGTADIYGPITSNGSIQYRVVGAVMDENSFLDLAYHRVKLVVPSIKFNLGADTSLLLRANYQDHHFRYHFGNGVQCLCDLSNAKPGDFVMPDIKRSVFFGQEWNRAHKEAIFLQGAFEHRFGNDWQLRVGTQYSHVSEYSANDSEQAPDRNGISIYGALYTNEKEDILYAGEVQLYGDVELFGTRNTLFFGADYQDQTGKFLQGFDGPFTGFNVFDPKYNIVAPRLNVSDYSFFINNINEVQEFGVTAQAFLRPVEGLTLSLGARFSSAKLISDRKAGGFPVAGPASLAAFRASPFRRFVTKTDKVTFQAGATYAVTPDINIYASYGETFEPRVAAFIFDPTTPLGRPAPPEEGRAYEVGAKGEFLNRRLSASLAAFHMVRSNLTQPHRGAPGLLDVLGTQQSDGVEFELQGAVTRDWNLFTSIAYMNPRYKGGQFDGLQSANGAKFGLSLFTTYEFSRGPLAGLGFGGGIVHKGGRRFFGSDRQYANGDFVVFDFGNFTEVDARIFYDLNDSWRFQLGVTNLFNEKYYSPPRDVLGFGVHVNPPRQFLFRASYKFR
jgi:iron complex outermembrane receptor protein